MTLVGLALAFTEKAVSKMRTAIVATHLPMLSEPHVTLLARVKAGTVRVPTAVLEFGLRRVQRKFAALAFEIAALGEERTILAFTICFRAAFTQDFILRAVQL